MKYLEEAYKLQRKTHCKKDIFRRNMLKLAEEALEFALAFTQSKSRNKAKAIEKKKVEALEEFADLQIRVAMVSMSLSQKDKDIVEKALQCLCLFETKTL